MVCVGHKHFVTVCCADLHVRKHRRKQKPRVGGWSVIGLDLTWALHLNTLWKVDNNDLLSLVYQLIIQGKQKTRIRLR